jgi:hypothetical protein
MRIKALDLLDSPPPNRDDEIDEISVPFGPAPAEQIVRPERTKASPEKCGIHGIYVPSSEGLSSPSWFKQDQSEKMTQRSLNKETRFFFCLPEFHRTQYLERNKHELAGHCNHRHHHHQLR